MTWIDLALDPGADRERLLASPELAPDRVRTRWNRALLAGARPEGPEDEPIVTALQLHHRRERLDPVIHALDDVLAPTLSIFESLDFTVLLADANGVVVDQRAGGGFREHAARVRLQEGAAWDEAIRGTNAIGTALAEGRPVAVHGGAHLASPNQGLVCYAAPVRDPWGNLIGVLDATSFLERASPLAGAAVLSAARALEEALRISSLAQVRGSIVERLLGRLRDPALLVAPDGQVTFANRQALDRGLVQRALASGPGEVVRVRGRLVDALGLEVVDLEAAARGQVRLDGIEVEPVQAPSGRTTAWLVVVVGSGQRLRRTAIGSEVAFDALVGTDPALARIRAHAARVAPSSLPVVLQGETGTGKELLAKGLHEASRRSQGPMVAVNCAAIAPSLLHSELFGYAPGAFTGADPAGREGKLAAAHLGTLFLDEIGEMPLELQALLLRFLEDGSYQRVGETTPRTSDVRLIGATCRDLAQMVDDGRFRADLYYRIRGVQLTLPAVRERTDRTLLCRSLLRQLGRELGLERTPELSVGAIAAIEERSWPGNVRQLKMAVHHGLVMCGDGGEIEAWHLPDATDRESAVPSSTPVPTPPSLDEAEALALKRALREAEGNVSKAARVLDVARSTVYRLMRKHGLGK